MLSLQILIQILQQIDDRTFWAGHKLNLTLNNIWSKQTQLITAAVGPAQAVAF